MWLWLPLVLDISREGENPTIALSSKKQSAVEIILEIILFTEKEHVMASTIRCF